MSKRKVDVPVYPDVEVLDLAGPFGVLSIASQLHEHQHFDVSLVAADHLPVASINGMRVCANQTFGNVPSPDILVIPGGDGSQSALDDETRRYWVNRAVSRAELVLSVCSGARILAAFDHLRDLLVTTHHEVFENIAELEPTARFCRSLRFVDTGGIKTSAGISAGIDASLHVVARLLGAAVALRTAEYMEYRWLPERDYQ